MGCSCRSASDYCGACGGFLGIQSEKVAPRDEGRRGDWMSTFTGGRFWPLDPRPEEVEIEDIAHALSQVCRFGGHSRRFYSVAEHSVTMACQFADPREGLWGLLHDAAEAYVGDMVRPLKIHMPEYKAVERGVLRAIAERFGLGDPPSKLVEVDNRVLLAEASALLGEAVVKTWRWVVEPADIVVVGYDPHVAKANFLRTFQALYAREIR